MNEIAETQLKVTMSSPELVEYINAGRRERAVKAGRPFPSKGYAEIRHDNLMKKIGSHPGIHSPKFLGEYTDSTGRCLKCYHLPEREARLIVMAESLEVQTKVLDRVMELETKQAKAQIGHADLKYAKLGADLMRAVRYQEYDSTKELEATLDKLDFEPAARAEGVPVSVIRDRVAMYTAATVRLDHIARGEHGHGDSVRDVVSLAQAKAQTEDMEAKIENRRLLGVEMAKRPPTLDQIVAYDMTHKHDTSGLTVKLGRNRVQRGRK